MSETGGRLGIDVRQLFEQRAKPQTRSLNLRNTSPHAIASILCIKKGSVRDDRLLLKGDTAWILCNQ